MDRELETIRADILGLYERALGRIDPGLKMKFGIEREGHAVLDMQALGLMGLAEPQAISQEVERHLDYAVFDIKEELLRRHPHLATTLEDVYLDQQGGSLLVEAVTAPNAPSVSAETMKNLAGLIQALIDEDNQAPPDLRRYKIDRLVFGHAEFETAPAQVMREGELFNADGSQILMGKGLLVARGTHGNVSLWFDDENLMMDQNMRLHVVEQAVDVVYHNMALLRSTEESYLRINMGSAMTATTIEGVFEKGSGALHIRLEENDKTRIEFRPADAITDPHDLEIVCCAPVVMAARNEVTVSRMSDQPYFVPDAVDCAGVNEWQAKDDSVMVRPMPRSLDESLGLFNSADNVLPAFINELAQEELRLAQARYNMVPNKIHEVDLIYIETLQDIGTRYHQLVMQQFGKESSLEASPREQGVHAEAARRTTGHYGGIV